MAERTGLEPATPGVTGPKTAVNLYANQSLDSNLCNKILHKRRVTSFLCNGAKLQKWGTICLGELFGNG